MNTIFDDMGGIKKNKNGSSSQFLYSLWKIQRVLLFVLDWVDYVEVETILLRLGLTLFKGNISTALFVVFQFQKGISSTLCQSDSFLVHGSMTDDWQNVFFATPRGVSMIQQVSHLRWHHCVRWCRWWQWQHSNSRRVVLQQLSNREITLLLRLYQIIWFQNYSKNNIILINLI